MNCFFFVFFFFAKLIWHEVWPFFFGFWMVHLREDCYFSLCFDLFDQMCFFFLFCLLNFTGLEVLVSADERFKNYKNDLFSHKSKELDRELMTGEENKHINSTISSYLRLLSGHLQLAASLRTLEYLIRRYK